MKIIFVILMVLIISTSFAQTRYDVEMATIDPDTKLIVTGADVTITGEGGATLIYDGTDSVWRMIGIAL